MITPITQPSSRAAVLLPTAVDMPFDYLVPEGTPEGAWVEATLSGRSLVGVVWESGNEKTDKKIPIEKLKPVTQRLPNIPPLALAFRKWIDWVSDFTLAPKGSVLALCGLPYAAKTPRTKFSPQQFSLQLPVLTPDQTAAYAALCGESTTRPILLDGVTGSGKTEVYFHAMAKYLTASNDACVTLGVPRTTEVSAQREGGAIFSSNNQLLILLPEISLTHQWLERFEKTFGTRPCVWHSRMTPAAKARAWQAIARGEAQVVVGARSALFLPFQNLRLIVVDEEHDPSYKQEDGVLYHARDMAVARAHFEKIPILLVSATPSLETLENVREGKYRAVHLPSRFGGAGLPNVQLIDLRNTPPERGNFLSPTVLRESAQTLARGEQVLFFLNRRGYAPLLLCRQCGHRFQCGDCSAWLVVHEKRSKKPLENVPCANEGAPRSGRGEAGASLSFRDTYLCCHHCDHREPFPQSCPACEAGAEQLVACGPGVERIAEEVRGVFGSSDICAQESTRTPSLVVLSSDEAIAPETWVAIEAGEVDILIGTQMVAKGHHFPRLTLVVVVDADVGLDSTDLRAGERAYQLLHQLGGRAGRAALSGTVLVQTYMPDHPVMKALASHDRARLMALEAQERHQGNWPPFGQLAAILIDGKEEASVRAAAQALARAAPEDARLRILGPTPAPLSKLRGQYRYRLLVKAHPGIHLQRTLRAWLAPHRFKSVRVKVDVNPYSFL